MRIELQIYEKKFKQQKKGAYFKNKHQFFVFEKPFT